MRVYVCVGVYTRAHAYIYAYVYTFVEIYIQCDAVDAVNL